MYKWHKGGRCSSFCIKFTTLKTNFFYCKMYNKLLV